MANYIAPQDPNPTSLRRWLLSPQAQTDLAAVSYGVMNPERLGNILYQCVNRTPKLATCELPDLMTATKTLVIMGCEPDNVHGYLVPRTIKNGNQWKTIPVPIPSARGLMRMARANGIQNLNIGAVYEHDTFEWYTRNGQFTMNHATDWNPGGRLLGFYCTWSDAQGHLHGERMSADEVNEIRARSDAYKRYLEKGTTCPWVTDYNQMALKTVIKRAAKQWDLPIEIQHAMQDADVAEFGDTRQVMREARVRQLDPENLPPAPTPAAELPPTPAAEQGRADHYTETLFPEAEDEIPGLNPAPAYHD
jgi:recombination protein RecT